MTLFGLDIAVYQTGLKLVDAWEQGFDFINIKLSHGLTDRSVIANPAGWADEARSLRMGVCTFHWLTNAPGAEQARYHLAAMREIGGPDGLAHQLDCEADATWPVWLDYVQVMSAELGRPFLNYSGAWWWRPRWQAAQKAGKPDWTGAPHVPYHWAAPNVGYLGTYPGDDSPHWTAGYGGWNELAVMQYAVEPIFGGTVDVSKSAIRDPNLWVALTGGAMGWHLNRALTNMRNEVNDRFPNRDKTSDGTIGDAAHSSTSSDHNPDPDGSVDAWDMDVNLRSADDAAMIEWLKSRFQRHTSSRYWIHNGRIASRDIDNWRRRPYDGPNPHDKHVHWNTRESHEDSTAPWGIKEVDMTPEEMLDVLIPNTVTGGSASFRGFIQSINSNAFAARNAATAADAKLAGMQTAIVSAIGQVDEAVAQQLADEFQEIDERIQSTEAADLERDQGLATQVSNVDEEVMAKIGDATLPPEQVAELLRVALGERADDVFRAGLGQ